MEFVTKGEAETISSAIEKANKDRHSLVSKYIGVFLKPESYFKELAEIDKHIKWLQETLS